MPALMPALKQSFKAGIRKGDLATELEEPKGPKGPLQNPLWPAPQGWSPRLADSAVLLDSAAPPNSDIRTVSEQRNDRHSLVLASS